jgi:phage shock protein PspC (stress-responsive transcriptional regulator)
MAGRLRFIGGNYMVKLPIGWQISLNGTGPGAATGSGDSSLLNDFRAMCFWHGICMITSGGKTREQAMSSENVINEIRESLNGRPGQPIVFGVCKALSDRFGKEPWIFRLAAIVLTLFWALPALAAYIIAGLVMRETEVRTRTFFSGLGVVIRENVERGAAWLRDCCEGCGRENRRSRGY